MRECAANEGKVPAHRASGGSGDGEHIPAYSWSIPGCRSAMPKQQEGTEGADVLSVFAHSQCFPQLGFGDTFHTLAAPTQLLGLCPLKWLGKMKGMNYLGFSNLYQNNFSFWRTVLLDMGWMHCAKAMEAGDASL